MAAQPAPEPRSAGTIDQLLTATIRGLVAARGLDADEAAVVLGMTKRTYYRRIQEGGWRATEIGLIADHFGVPVADIYAGRVTVICG